MRGVSIVVAMIVIGVIVILFVILVATGRFMQFLANVMLSSSQVYLGNALSLSSTLVALSTGDFVYTSYWKPLFLEPLNVSPDYVKAGSKFFGTGEFETDLQRKDIKLTAPFGSYNITIPKKDVFGTPILDINKSVWLVKGGSKMGSDFGTIGSHAILDYIYRTFYSESSRTIDLFGSIIKIYCKNSSVIINDEEYPLDDVICEGSVFGRTNVIIFKFVSSGNTTKIIITNKTG